jgi:two-component system, NarL family, nitrate/nitrite response regulator NarL
MKLSSGYSIECPDWCGGSERPLIEDKVISLVNWTKVPDGPKTERDCGKPSSCLPLCDIDNRSMKVLVVDDHPIFRDGLIALLQRLGAGTVILQAGDTADALKVVGEQAVIDVVILDLMMPGIGGLRAITELGQARPELPVVVLSSSEEPRDVRQALSLGALGYVPKSASPHTLLSAIRMVLTGGLYVPPLLLLETTDLHSPSPRVGPEGRDAKLTDRQIDVLRRLAKGQSNKSVALELSLSEKTVKAHITAIFKALNVVSRTQAARVGRELGII